MMLLDYGESTEVSYGVFFIVEEKVPSKRLFEFCRDVNNNKKRVFLLITLILEKIYIFRTYIKNNKTYFLIFSFLLFIYLVISH